jgi:hypothetical protein
LASDAPTAADLRRRIVTLVRDRVPPSWDVTECDSAPPSGTRGADFVLRLQAPSATAANLRVDVRQTLARRDVAGLVDEVRDGGDQSSALLVTSRYLSPSVREALADAGVSYADATGNVRISVDSPALFIADRGEDRDPWRKGRPLGTLKGEPAARVVRALLDSDRDWRARELVAASGASTGATYRVLEYLEREALLVKEGARSRVTDWERLLRAWSEQAPFQATTRAMAFIEPRGIDAVLGKIAGRLTFPVAVTGSVAAKQWATYAPARALYVYVSSIQEAAEQWGLRPNAAAPNVILLEPQSIGDVPFLNTVESSDGYPIAAPAQVAADLLNGPGREPEEGEYLIEWMRANEGQWRRG